MQISKRLSTLRFNLANGVFIALKPLIHGLQQRFEDMAGALLRLLEPLVRALEDYKKAGLFVLGLDGGGDVALADSNLLDGPLVIVVGAEGAGLSRLVRETCDQIASIPISSATESLNASVAASIALYEASKALPR